MAARQHEVPPADGGRQWHLTGLPHGANSTLFVAGGVSLSLADISNDNASNNAGWAIRAAIVEPIFTTSTHLSIQALLAVRDSDGYMRRMSYQANVLGVTG